jgi:hypothetical protein
MQDCSGEARYRRRASAWLLRSTDRHEIRNLRDDAVITAARRILVENPGDDDLPVPHAILNGHGFQFAQLMEGQLDFNRMKYPKVLFGRDTRLP